MHLLSILNLFVFGIIIFDAKLNVLGADGPSCKSVVSDIGKKQMTGIGVCTKSMKFKNSKEKSAKSTCILKCVLQREELLNEEGIMNKEVLEKALEKNIPEMWREKVGAAFLGCCEKHGATVDPKEELCKSYDPLIKCLMASFPTICA